MICRSIYRPTFKTTQSFASMAPVYAYFWIYFKLNHNIGGKIFGYSNQPVGQKPKRNDYASRRRHVVGNGNQRYFSIVVVGTR